MSEATDWNKLTIPQLKEQLKKRGLDQTGKKADLISRLLISEQADEDESKKTKGEGTGGQPTKEETFVETTGDVEQMDTTDNPDADETAATEKPVTEGEDFSENITFDELDEKKEHQPTTTLEAADTLTVAEAKDAAASAAPTAEDAGGEGGGEATGEGGEGKLEEAAAEEEEEEPDVSDQFAIDMPKDRDCFKLTWNSKKLIVPFRNEVHADLVPSFKERSLLIHPVELADLSSDVFKGLLERTQKFSIYFHDKSSGKTTTGQVRLLLKSSAEAEEVKEQLKAFRETLTVDHLTFEFKDSDDDFLPIVRKEQTPDTGSVVQRLLFVGNLPIEGVTEATLSDLFPDALRVILPHKEIEGNAENLEQTRHAYIEYGSEEEAAAALETHKGKELNDEKLFVTRAIGVRKDRFGLLSDSLRQIFIDKVRKLQRIQKNPYNKSQHDLNEIEKTIVQTKEKLALDTKHRIGWGMLLGRLDESAIDKDDEPKKIGSINQRGRDNNQRGRGNRGGQMRGSNFRGGQSRGLMAGMGGNMRGGFGGYNAGGGGMGYGRGGWNTGGYGGGGQFQSYYGGGGAGGSYPTQSYGGGYNQFSGNKRRASYDNYSGEWKRGRGSYQQY